MEQIKVNGHAYLVDLERASDDALFMSYRELLLTMVGLGASVKVMNAAKSFIYKHYPQYMKFIPENER